MGAQGTKAIFDLVDHDKLIENLGNETVDTRSPKYGSGQARVNQMFYYPQRQGLMTPKAAGENNLPPTLDDLRNASNLGKYMKSTQPNSPKTMFNQ